MGWNNLHSWLRKAIVVVIVLLVLFSIVSWNIVRSNSPITHPDLIIVEGEEALVFNSKAPSYEDTRDIINPENSIYMLIRECKKWTLGDSCGRYEYKIKIENTPKDEYVKILEFTMKGPSSLRDYQYSAWWDNQKVYIGEFKWTQTYDSPGSGSNWSIIAERVFIFDTSNL